MPRALVPVVVLPLAFAAAAAVAATPARPNFVVIVSDNQAYRDLGCYGSPEAVTPHLDQLAAEGVKATNFYVMSPACTPSRGSILTGRYPQRNGLYEMIRNEMVRYGHRYTPEEYAYSPEMTLGLDQREITLGEMLQAAGYATAAIGKWDSGRARRHLPLQNGFDTFYGFAATGIDYWTHERYGVPSMFRNNDPVKEPGYCDDLFTREALRFIREHRARPFCVYLAYHAPSGNANLDEKRIRPPKKFLDLYPRRDPTDRRTEYLAAISAIDDGIGQILSTLGDLELDASTLVLFFPDNGSGPPGDPGGFNLGGSQIDRLGEAGIRVNFLARWPGRLPAGRTISDVLSSLDLFPTLMALAAGSVPAETVLDGIDLLPVLRGETRLPARELFWKSRHSRAARSGQFKWIEAPLLKGLFDLSTDPGEKHDLSERQPEVLARIKARWADWERQMEAAEPRGPFRNY